MSVHVLPLGADLETTKALCKSLLRYPEGVVFANGINAQPTALQFTPDLTAGQITTLGTIFNAALITKPTTADAALFDTVLKTADAAVTLLLAAQTIKALVRKVHELERRVS